MKKVGHCGTLDPNATGLLIIVLGRGTKLSEKLMSQDKVYEGTIKFGRRTKLVPPLVDTKKPKARMETYRFPLPAQVSAVTSM